MLHDIFRIVTILYAALAFSFWILVSSIMSPRMELMLVEPPSSSLAEKPFWPFELVRRDEGLRDGKKKSTVALISSASLVSVILSDLKHLGFSFMYLNDGSERREICLSAGYD